MNFYERSMVMLWPIYKALSYILSKLEVAYNLCKMFLIQRICTAFTLQNFLVHNKMVQFVAIIVLMYT